MPGQHRYEPDLPSTGAGTVCLDVPGPGRMPGQRCPCNTSCAGCGRPLRVDWWVRPAAPHGEGTGFLCCPCYWGPSC